MKLTPEILATLCCPVGRSPLRAMAPAEITQANGAVARGTARYADGEPVVEPLTGGLATADGACVYRVDEGIPVLLPGRRVVLSAAEPSHAPEPRRAPDPDPWAARWEDISRRWAEWGPPARPSAEDTEILASLVDRAWTSTGRRAPRALMLGVTPEIATMRWPVGTRLLALDSSAGMIRNVWPAVADGSAVLGDWLAMPVRAATYDVVVADGSFSVPPYPDGSAALVREMRRVLRDDGALAVRLFTRPETPEPVAAIFAALRAGRIGSLDALKWRLVMALHRDTATGARMGDVWDAWEAFVPRPGALLESLGWPPDASRVFAGLRGLDARLTFPTLAESRAAIAAAFEEVACVRPRYEDGERYPTMLFRPRVSA